MPLAKSRVNVFRSLEMSWSLRREENFSFNDEQLVMLSSVHNHRAVEDIQEGNIENNLLVHTLVRENEVQVHVTTVPPQLSMSSSL
jgi:hypothetical protein